MAGENQMPSDFFEKLVHDFATRLGFQVRFENTTPRVLKTQIQIQSLAGAVQVEGDLHSVMGWLKDRVATQQSIDLMLVEHKELTRLFS